MQWPLLFCELVADAAHMWQAYTSNMLMRICLLQVRIMLGTFATICVAYVVIPLAATLS